MNNPLDLLGTLLNQFAVAIPRIFGALMVAIIGIVIAKTVSKIVAALLKTVGVDKAAEKLNDIDALREYKVKIVPSTLFSKVLYYMVVLIFMIAATDVLGMPAVSDWN